MIITQKIQTSIGEIIAGATDDGLCLFDFAHRKMLPTIEKRVKTYFQTDFQEGTHKYIDDAELQLEEYLAGNRQEFELPLLLSGTPFQNKVWQALLTIPYGSTRTYMQQAKILGDEKAIRAVARANGENCFAIVVPCHRVVGANGSLTGYAGGLLTKKWLLSHEAKHCGIANQATLF